MSAPLPVITQFIEGHGSKLRGVPLAFFAAHLQNNGAVEAGRKARLACLDPIRRPLRLQHEARLSGVYDPEKISYIERRLEKTVQTPVAAFRD